MIACGPIGLVGGTDFSQTRMTVSLVVAHMHAYAHMICPVRDCHLAPWLKVVPQRTRSLSARGAAAALFCVRRPLVAYAAASCVRARPASRALSTRLAYGRSRPQGPERPPALCFLHGARPPRRAPAAAGKHSVRATSLTLLRLSLSALVARPRAYVLPRCHLGRAAPPAASLRAKAVVLRLRP